MSSHVPLDGGREREITQGGTWDELPCEWGVESGKQGREGQKISPSLLIRGGHRMSSHVPPNRGRGNIKPLPLL